jgi:hypothetical protein
MKRIPARTAREIEDFSIEAPHALPSYALEKDLLALDALRTIAEMPPIDGYRLVFCGGTCLSKAYGALDRMSEDLDFKVVPDPAAPPTSGSATRRRLGALADQVASALEGPGGFGERSVTRRSRDANDYSALDIEFESAFAKPQSMRPHILVELSHAALLDPTAHRPLRSLFDELTGRVSSEPLRMECVSMREALTEKLVSFPRRLALHLSRTPDKPLSAEAGWDEALVRHLYDVARIAALDKDLVMEDRQLGRMVEATIAKDAVDFAAQHPAFVRRPIGELERALAWASSSSELERQYGRFTRDMVYGDPASTPSYATALALFEAVLSTQTAPIDQTRLSNRLQAQLGPAR